MTDSSKISVPIFLVPVPREAILSMQSCLTKAQDSVSAIERETGRLLTAGNQSRHEAIVSFGHDVFALLFSFPANYRSLNTFFNKVAGTNQYETRNGDVSKIYEFFSRLDYATRVPVDKTLRGKFYPARWDSRENIPCLVRRAEDATGELPVYQSGLDNVADASMALNTACKEALAIWEPFLADVRKQHQEWRETTEEGRAYDENFRQRIQGILAGK